MTSKHGEMEHDEMSFKSDQISEVMSRDSHLFNDIPTGMKLKTPNNVQPSSNVQKSSPKQKNDNPSGSQKQKKQFHIPASPQRANSKVGGKSNEAPGKNSQNPFGRRKDSLQSGKTRPQTGSSRGSRRGSASGGAALNISTNSKTKPNIAQAQSKIKDQIARDRKEFSGANKWIKKQEACLLPATSSQLPNLPNMQNLQNLQNMPNLQEDNDCTFRSIDNARHNNLPFGGNFAEDDVFDISKDDPSRASTNSRKLLGKPKGGENRAGGGLRESIESMQQKGDDDGVMDIASRLLSSEVLKRFNTSHTGQRETAGWKNSTEKPRNQGLPTNESQEFGGQNPSEESSRLRQKFYEGTSLVNNNKNSREQFETPFEDRKEQFNREDYELNFETSRASSSQFSAFNPNDEVKSFFRQEFVGEMNPSLALGTRPQIDLKSLGEFSNASSKITYPLDGKKDSDRDYQNFKDE